MKRIGFVGEYGIHEGKYVVSPDAKPALDYLASRSQVYVINPLNQRSPEEALDVRAQEEVQLDPASMDVFYFGRVGKKIPLLGQDNCFALQLPEFFRLFDQLLQYEPNAPFVNPSETMLANISKEYLLQISNDVPIIPTRRIESLDELVDLSKRKEPTIVKPLISERAIGTMIINGRSREELQKLFNSYSPSNGDSPYGRIIRSQGLIVQPYLEEFVRFGETKLMVVNGEVTLAKKSRSEEAIVEATTGITEAYTPSDEEVKLAREVFRVFTKHWPSTFARVDMVGSPGNLKINEIEAINPNCSEARGIYSDETLERHHHVLFDPILN